MVGKWSKIVQIIIKLYIYKIERKLRQIQEINVCNRIHVKQPVES